MLKIIFHHTALQVEIPSYVRGQATVSVTLRYHSKINAKNNIHFLEFLSTSVLDTSS